MTVTPRRSLRSGSTSSSHSPSPSRMTTTNKLRPVSPEELEAWHEHEHEGDDHDSDATLSEPQPSDLDEPWPFTFSPGEAVWIRTAGGNWYAGKVSGQTTRKGQTRVKEGLYYPVIFCDKLRKYFAPLNGEIKPDTVHVRGLLKEAGWI